MILIETLNGINSFLLIIGFLLVGIAPLVGAALIGSGTALLQGIFSGLGKKEEREQMWEDLQKQMKLQQEQWKERGDIRSANIEEKVRPKGEFYNIADPGSYAGAGGAGSLAQIDPMMKQAVLGMMQSRLGEGFGGVDWGGAMEQIGQPRQATEAPVEAPTEPERKRPVIPRGEMSARRGMGKFMEMIKRRGLVR